MISRMKYLIKVISILLWVTKTNQSIGLHDYVKQPSNSPEKHNDQTQYEIVKTPQFEPPFPLIPMNPMQPFPPRRMPYEPKDYDLQYQTPQFLPPIRLDIQFMAPPIYRVEAPSKSFKPLPPQMSAPYSFVLVPLSTSTPQINTTTTSPVQLNTSTDYTPKTTNMPKDFAMTSHKQAMAYNKDDCKKNLARRSVGFSEFAPRFFLVEDTETNVIDTWKEANDFRYFANKWYLGSAPNIQLNHWKKSKLKQNKNKHTTRHPLIRSTKKPIELTTKEHNLVTKRLKNMVRIIPLKKEVLRKVTAQIKQKAQRNMNPLVGKLLKYEYDRNGAVVKIIDFDTALNQDRTNID